ncbi:MAG: hypothetical protein E6761_16455 [Coprobacillus sp.]|nr:hypothetical protein [Coprobacillus sp.]
MIFRNLSASFAIGDFLSTSTFTDCTAVDDCGIVITPLSES